MELHTLIYRLLFQYDCIIVPNFGAFVCTYKKMEFNPQQGYINPARKLVSFNQNLIADDGLLADFIGREEEIDTPTTYQKITDWVAYINNRIQQGQTMNLKGIGSFCLDDEKNLVFVPETTANFLPETYGLQKLKLPEKGQKIQPVEEVVAISPLPDTITETQLPEVILAPTLPPISKKESPKRLKKHPVPEPVATLPPPREKKKGNFFTRRVAYYILLTLLIACFFFLQDYMYHSKLSFGSLLPTRSSQNTTKNNPPAAPTKPIPNSQPANSLQNSTTTQPNVDTLPPQNSQNDTIYYIIAGAFSTEKNAADLVTELEATGKTLSIIKTPGSPLYRVGIGQFATRVEANTRLDATRAELKNPGAWVLAVKK